MTASAAARSTIRSGGGKVVEVGGQWIGPTQDHLAALARELGVGTYKTYNNGNYLFYEAGKLTPYTPTGPFGAVPPDLTAAAQALRADPEARLDGVDGPAHRAVEGAGRVGLGRSDVRDVQAREHTRLRRAEPA